MVVDTAAHTTKSILLVLQLQFNCRFMFLTIRTSNIAYTIIFSNLTLWHYQETISLFELLGLKNLRMVPDMLP